MDEYQNRRDIDKIYDDLYDQTNGSLNVVAFTNESKYKNISSKDDGSDRGTIDAIIDYYGLVDTVSNNELLNLIYPVGAIFFDATDRDTCPIQILLGGVWERIEDRFLLASGSEYDTGDTDGESEHTLTVDEMPSHHHQIDVLARYPATGGANASIGYSKSGTHQNTSYTGGGQAHNNMPPYLVVNVWNRIE